MAEDQEHSAFMRVIIGESNRFPELAKICVQAMTKPVLEALSRYFTAHPELNIPDPEATARILVGTLVYFHITQDVMHGKDILPMENARVIDAVTHLITHHAD
jgi:TetR/AcrR family transcriptional regulator of autoinduction and epiphytic fitness